MDLGTCLKSLRIQKGLTQRELAEIVGYSHQTIATLERNEGISRIILLKKLCELFNVSSDYLINGIIFNKLDSISTEEMNLIQKYRNLSDYYKSIINHIIETEENR